MNLISEMTLADVGMKGVNISGADVELLRTKINEYNQLLGVLKVEQLEIIKKLCLLHLGYGVAYTIASIGELK